MFPLERVRAEGIFTAVCIGCYRYETSGGIITHAKNCSMPSECKICHNVCINGDIKHKPLCGYNRQLDKIDTGILCKYLHNGYYPQFKAYTFTFVRKLILQSEAMPSVLLNIVAEYTGGINMLPNASCKNCNLAIDNCSTGTSYYFTNKNDTHYSCIACLSNILCSSQRGINRNIPEWIYTKLVGAIIASELDI